jgi:hypothetical protein
MKKIFAILLAAGLAACSGGGDDDGATVTPSNGEPNDTMAQATLLTLDTPVSGTISARSDVDFYKFTVPAGGATVRFQTFDSGGTQCDPNFGNVDPFLEVYDPTQVFVDGDDDSFAPFCEDFSVALPAGLNYVMVGGWEPVPFNYVLKVTIPAT